MGAPEAEVLIARIGLASQLATALLLALLFSLLYRLAQRKEYFFHWACAWGLISLGLAALFVHFFALSLSPGQNGAYDASERLADGVYQFCKLGYLTMLVVGTLNYVRGLRSAWWLYAGFILLVCYAATSVAMSDILLEILIWQAPLSITTYAVCAVLLFTLPSSRATVGSGLTASVFAAFGVMSALYLSSMIVLPAEEMTGFTLFLWHLVLYNGFLDMLLQMLLAFGMVLLFMEDVRREIVSTHSELALAHSKLQEESLRDSLTRALNRRAFNEGAGLKAARAGFGTAVVFDLDNLKQVNDTYGHQAGDALLKYFVKALRPHLRVSDKLYRFGGDEFLLIMPRAHREKAIKRFQDFFADVPPLPIADGGVSLPLEVSLGAALYASGERLDAAVQEADREMYAHKREHKLNYA